MTINHPEYVQKRWIIAPPMDVGVSNDLKEYPRLLRKLLYNRGILTPEVALDFLQGGDHLIHDPYLMMGMHEAVERILQAMANNEQIVIYGDYDVDGVTATALLVECFRLLGMNVEPYIPNRFDEGYGLNQEALKSLREREVPANLVISVDCGIRSQEDALYAKKIGLDLIITDHHHPSKDIPECVAVLDPKRDGDKYPYKDLAGVGIAYKLAHAVIQKVSPGSNLAEKRLDLVALGTVADMAPLTGENRELVRRGISLLQKGDRVGIRALCAEAGIPYSKINASDIGFMIGPRLNAAGRLETAMDSFQLLVSRDDIQAMKCAASLQKQNEERQKQTRATQQKAIELIGQVTSNDYLLFVIDPEFNEGIVGLAASRLTEQFYRPSVVGKIDQNTTRCSCRSIPGFHISQVLDECKDLLVKHGGHAAAAGFTVENIYLAELENRLKEIACRQLHNTELVASISAEAEVCIKDLTVDFFHQQEYLHPLGYGNPEPYYVIRNVQVLSKSAIGKEKNHLRLRIKDKNGSGLVMNAIAFNFGFINDVLPDLIDILGSLEMNYYNGQASLQIRVKDIKAASSID